MYLISYVLFYCALAMSSKPLSHDLLHPRAENIPTSNPLDLLFRVNEIFYSIQGEGTRAGLPCVFVRLHGCKLRCSYCDTTYAIDRRSGGTQMTGQEIDNIFRSYQCSFIEFTGGEPLEEINVFPLMRYYCDQGYTVAVETGGHVDASLCDKRVIRIIDMKTPSSNMMRMNNYTNLLHLRPHDEVKFVIGSREDYEWSRDLVREYALYKHCTSVLFSPVFNTVPYQELVSWILEDRLPVRFQLQMHKFIWSPDTRGV